MFNSNDSQAIDAAGVNGHAEHSVKSMDYMDNSFEISDQKPVCLLVLGPHRSGTSALSGVLNHLGGDLPATLMPAEESNAGGYFESLRIMAFNDKLLNTFGSDWKDLSPLDLSSAPAQVFESLMSEAVKILHEEFSAAHLPLLKDPRICRFVGFWTEAFTRAGYRTLYIHTHRNPLETAESLDRRDGIEIETGLLIWLRHVLDAEAATRGRTRVFTNYKALLDNWRTQIAQIEEVLGLTFHRNTANIRQNIDDFLSDTLRHQHRAPEEVRKSAQVADIVYDTFRIFESWGGSAGSPSDYDTLDALRHRLNESLDQIVIFVRAQSKAKELAVKLRGLEQSLGQLRDEKARLTTELERDRQTGAEREAAQTAKIVELQKDGAQLQDEKARLAAELEHDRQAGAERDAAHSAQVAELKKDVGQLEDEKARLAAELEHDRQVGAERDAAHTVKIAELEKDVGQLEDEKARLATELEHDRLADAERHAAHTTKIAELEKDVGRLQDEKSRLTAELEHDRQVGAERDAAHSAQVAELGGEVRQRSLEAEEWFAENGRLAQVLATLQAEKIKLEDERGEETTRLQESLRARDHQVRGLEKNVDERFEEILQLSKILLDTQAQQEAERVAQGGKMREAQAQLEAERVMQIGKLRQVNERVEALQHEIAQTKQREAQTRKTVEMLLSSTSWKVTGPIRSLVTWLRRRAFSYAGRE